MQQLQRLVGKRAEDRKLLLDILYNTTGDKRTDLEEMILNSLNLRDQKILELNKLEIECKEVSNNLSSLQQEIEVLSHQNRQSQTKDKKKETVTIDDKSRLQLEIYETLQHVLQTYILSTVENWSQDEELLRIMMTPSKFDCN